MAERHPELVREAEFLLNEGGTIRADEAGHVEYVGVGTTEKSPFWLELTARGTAGHRPRPPPPKPGPPPGPGPAPGAGRPTPPPPTPERGGHFPPPCPNSRGTRR